MIFFSKKRKKILILWYTYQKNLGDYYLFKTVQSYAKLWGYDVCGMDIGEPYEKIAKASKKFDYLWFAGGGIIERGVPDIIRNFPLFYEKTNHILYGVTGLSVGNFDYTYYSTQISSWVQNSSFFYARDDYTADLLNSMSKIQKVLPSADVVFAYKDFEIYKASCQKLFGANFRSMPYPDLTGEINWSQWNNMINETVFDEIIGIPDQLDVSQHFSFNFESKYSPQKVVNIISQIDYGIAMRYHVILIAAMMGKVCIPIDYCPKVTRLAEQLGISDLVLHYNEANKFKNIFMLYSQNEDHYKKIVETNVQLLKLKALEMFKTVESIIKQQI